MIIFRRSTFTLIGRRALQKCVFCHKHNKTHNGNAFHMWKFFFCALLLPFSFIHSFVFIFTFALVLSYGQRLVLFCCDEFALPASKISSFIFIPFRCLALGHSCESISWWSVIESPHWWSLHWVADDGRRVQYIIISKQKHILILTLTFTYTMCPLNRFNWEYKWIQNCCFYWIFAVLCNRK